MKSEWTVWRLTFRYVVVRLEYANAMGSWYALARNTRGNIARFWRRSTAQAYADQLNNKVEYE